MDVAATDTKWEEPVINIRWEALAITVKKVPAEI
jgi:hypothetical protein